MTDARAEDPAIAHAEALLEGWVSDGKKSSRGKETTGDKGEEEHGEPSQKQLLLRLAEEVDLFTDERDRAYAWIDREGHREVWPLNGSTFENGLAHGFYRLTGDAPSGTVLKDVLRVLSGQARFESPTYALSNRLARAEDGAIWYDLADDDWRAVRVDADGWNLAPAGPPEPTFRRFAHQQAQVEPVPGGNLADLLLPFLNVPEPEPGEPVADKYARVLALVWPVVALVPDIPRTILIPWGRQGSAKSHLTRVFRQIVDPSSTPMPRFPRGDAEMAQVLDHHAAPFFDNVSRLSQRESDTLCRAVTGDGFSKRKLYTDDEDVLYQFRRALLLNGINVPAQRPDLLDRAVLLRMEKIEEEDRVEERVFWHRFEEARPRILGAVLDALSMAMRLEPDVQLGALPRMADWSRWGYAVAEALGLGGDTFLDAYRANRKAADDEALGSHPVGAAVMVFMDSREEWTGQPSALLRKLEKVAEPEKIDTGHKLWPGAPNWLSRRINEVEHNLAKAGIRWDRGESDNRFVRLWREEEESAEDAAGAAGTGETPAAPEDSDPQHDPGIPHQSDGAERMPGDSRSRRHKGSPGTRGTPGISQAPYPGDGPAPEDSAMKDAAGAGGTADQEEGHEAADDGPNPSEDDDVAVFE